MIVTNAVYKLMIQVKNLIFKYPHNEILTIKDISFNVNAGEIFGFLGPSGAGKTTIQKILIGILKNYSGSVNVLGKEIRTINSDYYESLGVSFEFPNLFSKFTAIENLNFFRKMYSCKTEEPMKLLELVGLDKDANTRVSEFSKGMKMRLNFCRSLLNNPDVLFLDEPSSGLDPVNVQKMKEIIFTKKAEGKTVCITTHDMNIADSLCDRVAFIVEGKIALIDSPRILKLKYGNRTVKLEYRENSDLRIINFELDQLGNNDSFLEIIKNKSIETIHTQEASLADIFIKTTGRNLQ